MIPAEGGCEARVFGRTMMVSTKPNPEPLGADPGLDLAWLVAAMRVALKRLAGQVAARGQEAVRAYLAAKTANLARLGE